jgi:hypothetical protein
MSGGLKATDVSKHLHENELRILQIDYQYMVDNRYNLIIIKSLYNYAKSELSYYPVKTDENN